MSNIHMPLKEFFQVHNTLESGEIILDVRNPDEFAEGHIEGATNIPLPEIENRVGDLKNYKRIYIHCKRGGRAKTAFDKLVQAGLQNLVCISDAGMDSWIELGYPVKK